MMNTESNRDTWFERELRAEHSSAAINFDAVEACILRRINKAEEIGVLSLLKSEIIVSPETFERLEKDLFAQIGHFKEYEEPVNECIQAEVDLTHAQWERLEAKLFSKIKDCSEAPLWEQLVMAPQSEPVPGHWEQIEDRIFSEIIQSDKQEPWILCARNEEVCAPAIIEKEEQFLEEILSEKEPIKSFEQQLKREVVLSLSQLEKIEDSLFARIERYNSQVKLEKQPFWMFIEHYFTVFRTAGLVSALILFFIGGITFYNQFYRNPETPVDTFAYQVHGAAVNIPGITGRIGQRCYSVLGGTVKLFNKHGSIELQNDANIEILKVTQKAAHYRVSLSGVDHDSISDAQVAFLVNRHGKDEEFLIHTTDYQIMVKGTYFRLEPGFRGTVTTRVLEGVIKVSSTYFDDTEIHAGQILYYDSLTERYTVKGGGQVVLRQNIETVPQIDSLIKFGMLQINSSVADAQVRVNGKHYGSVPVALRCGPGRYSISLSSEGYMTLDTVITITHDKPGDEISFTLNKVVKPVITEKVQVKKPVEKNEVPAVIDSKPQADSSTITPDLISSKLLEPDNSALQQNEELYTKAQTEELAGNWQAAIGFYQMVFDDQNSSRLIREDALFSIGRLKADYVHNPAEASQVFLTYLALFPQGSFAGESWLRLAELEFRSRPENATRYYEKFFQLFPQHPRIVELKNRVGVIYLQQKRFDEAIGLFREALNSPAISGEKEKALVSENLKRALQQKATASKNLVNR